MSRILITLGTLSLALMVAALVLGLSVGDLYDRPNAETLRWATVHRLTGTFAALAVVFVQSVIIAGRQQQAFGVACQQADGSWQVVSR